MIREPWKLIKTEGAAAQLSRVLWNGLEAVRIVATGLLPFMPRVAAEVLAAVGVGRAAHQPRRHGMGRHARPAPSCPSPSRCSPASTKRPTSPRSRPAEKEKTMETAPPPRCPAIAIDQFFQTELKVATVVAAEPVPKSSKLLKLTVDLGEGAPRTVVAGIALAYKPEELVGKQVVVVANLQPAKLMGIESNGMVLAASLDGKPVLLHPAVPVPNGTRVK